MSRIDKLIPVYVWLTYGFGTAQLPMSIVGYVSAVASALILMGFIIPLIDIVKMVILVMIFCTVLGGLLTKYKFWERTTSYINQNANPEIKKIHTDIQNMNNDLKIIKKHLGVPEDK
jgi:hypothetical protein